MHDIRVFLQIGQCRNHGVTAPIGNGGSDDVIGFCTHGNAPAAAAPAGTGCGVRDITLQGLPDGTHADFVTQITDGDVQNPLVL